MNKGKSSRRNQKLNKFRTSEYAEEPFIDKNKVDRNVLNVVNKTKNIHKNIDNRK